MCCYVIVTARTLIWSLLSIAATLSMLAAIWTPIWLIGPPKRLNKQLTAKWSQTSNTDKISEFLPSLGLFNRCTKIYQFNRLETECAPFVTGLDQDNNSFPNAWKASLIFFVIGISVMSLTIIASLLGCCKRSICRKSIFTISGTIQAVAGLFYILGIFCYPFGWGTDRVGARVWRQGGPFSPGRLYNRLGTLPGSRQHCGHVHLFNTIGTSRNIHVK